MADSEKLRWLLEPPGEGQAHVYVAVGEGAKLSPAVLEALDKLMAALQETDEVQGFMMKSTGIVRTAGPCDITRTFGDLTTQLQPDTQVFGCNISGINIGM